MAQTGAPEEILKQAVSLHQAGDIARAIDAYKTYLAARPDSVMAHSNLGAAYVRVARYEDAIGEYKTALKLQPGNVPVELNLALAYYKTGRKELAAASAEKVHKAAPLELQPALILADCWLAMGKEKGVVEVMAPFSERNPEDMAIAYLLGTALIRDNQVERGQVVIDRILRNGESAEARLLLGTTKLSAREYPAALVDLKRAVELNPELPDVYSYYGLAQLGAGDPESAADSFRKELGRNPNDYTANIQLSVLLKQDEKLTEAADLLRRALQARPGDPAARFQLAGVDLRLGNAESAKRELEALIKESPGFVEAHVTLATVYYRLKRKEDGDRERTIVQKLNSEKQAQQQKGLNVK